MYLQFIYLKIPFVLQQYRRTWSLCVLHASLETWERLQVMDVFVTDFNETDQLQIKRVVYKWCSDIYLFLNYCKLQSVTTWRIFNINWTISISDSTSNDLD